MLGDQQGSGHNQDEPDQRQGFGAAPVQARQLLAEQCYAGAEHEFKQAGGQQIVSGGGVAAGHVDRQRKGGHQGNTEWPVGVAAFAEAVGQVQGGRPEQIELFLHGQRPGMQQ